LPDKEKLLSESRKWSLAFLGMGGANFIGYGMAVSFLQ